MIPYARLHAWSRTLQNTFLNQSLHIIHYLEDILAEKICRDLRSQNLRGIPEYNEE